MSNIFYLKVNRDENYTYRNLQHWIDILDCIPEAVAYIVCDKETVKEKIFEKVNFINTKVFMMPSSVLDDAAEFILSNICLNRWRKAGLAHLTTFIHAKENQFNDFWNIDADDTYICLDKLRCAELLNTSEKYAKENKIDLFSLDMWCTRYYGAEWSFGITYVNNSVDWLEYMKEHCVDHEYKKIGALNIDRYFMYLRKIKKYAIETFYFENLRFIHYSDDFFQRIINSGLFHWCNGYLSFPLVEACLGLGKLSKIMIPDDIIKLDIGISDEETKNMFFENTLDKISLEIFNDIADEHFVKKQCD